MMKLKRNASGHEKMTLGYTQAHKSMENTESDPSNARNQPLSNSRKTDEQAMKRL